MIFFFFLTRKVFTELIVEPSLMVSKGYNFGWVSLVSDMFHWTTGLEDFFGGNFIAHF